MTRLPARVTSVPSFLLFQSNPSLLVATLQPGIEDREFRRWTNDAQSPGQL